MSESINVARLKKGSDVFEVVIDPEKAMEARKDPSKIRDALVYPKIFSDAKKGMIASEKRMEALFNTSDPIEVAKRIIKEGTIQLTSEYRQKVVEQKRKRIIDLIHKNGVDPRTNAPHPAIRIEAAMNEAKVKIDEHKPAEMQMEQILKAIRPIIPIKFAVKEIEITIPAEFASRAQNIVRMMAKILSEKWNTDGSWTGKIEIPGGLEQELYDKLNSVSHGQVQSRLIQTR